MAVFTALATALLGVGASTLMIGLTAAGMQIAAGIGLSLIAKSLAGEPKGPQFGVQGQIQGGDDVPRSILFGYNCTAGSFAYGNTWGTVDGVPNAYLTQVIALADYPIDSLQGIIVDNIPATILTGSPHATYGYPIDEYRKNGRDHLWVKFYDGTQESADSFLVNIVDNADRPYTSDRVGAGIPYVIVTALAPERVDGEEKPLFSGLPSFKFITYGAKLYDISKDSSVGGSGSHRWDDPETWGGDGDFLPIVQVYNILRGIRFNGQWLYGLQSISPAQLPPADWISVINKCRAEIEGPDGEEPTYRTGGEIQVAAQVKLTIEALLTGCQGRLTEIGGIYKPHVGEPGAPVMAFDDSEILSTENQSFTPFYGLEDTITGVQATYPNPGEGWNTKTAPPLFRTDVEASIGNRRMMANVSLDLVPYGAQVQRLMKSALSEAQRARRHTITMGPEFWVLEPGDTINWTSVRNGYETKLFRVDGIGDKENLDVILDITEVDPSDYDWNQDTDFTPIIDGPLQLVGTPPLPMIGWQVYPAIIKDETGRDRRPGIEVWYQSGLQDVDMVRIQVRVPTEINPFIDLEVPYGDPWKIQIPGNFPPNSVFEVRGIYVRTSGGLSSWSEWLTVLTPDVKLIAGEDFDPYSGVVGFEQLDTDLAAYQEWLGQDIRQIIEEAEANATNTAGQELANSIQFQEVRFEISTVSENLGAAFQQIITVAILPMQGELQALADWVTELSAGDGDDISSSRFRMTAVTGPTGYSRIAAETRVDTTDPEAWRGAAWFLDTPNDPLLPTRFLVQADQFIVMSPAGEDNPLIYDGTALRLNVANIGTVNAGLIQSSDGLSFWDLDTGAFSITAS